MFKQNIDTRVKTFQPSALEKSNKSLCSCVSEKSDN